MSYDDLINQNIAPYLAQKIGIFNSAGEKVGVIPLGDFKPEYGARLYRVGLLSDVHNEETQNNGNSNDFKRALQYFNTKQSVCMTCIAGDVVQANLGLDISYFKNLVDTYSPNTPVYTTIGNHDCNYYSDTTWQANTGHGKTFEITKTVLDGKKDHYLFLGMHSVNNTWSLGPSGTPFLDTDIDWLEDKLEDYKDERSFVFVHPFMQGYSGDQNGVYMSVNGGVAMQGAQLTRLKNLVAHYTNTVWFTGHSHWKWYLQKYDDNANIYRPTGGGWTVHIPSCAYPIDSDGVSTRVTKGGESEGGIMDVYENYIDVRAMDLLNEKYLPIAQYRLDTTIQSVTANRVTITNTLSHATNSNSADKIMKGRSYSATVSPTSGYEISSVTVTMGGTNVTSSVYNSSTHVISISNVTGAIVIIVSTSAQLPVYTITNNLSHASNSNSETSLVQGSSYTGTILASSGYAISSISVTMGGTNITSSAVSGNVITISSITGNVVITVSTVSVYSVTNTLSHVTNSNSATTVNGGASYSCNLNLASGYNDIDSVVVTMGGTDITATAYNSSTNAISISNVTGNIVITANAIKLWATVNLSDMSLISSNTASISGNVLTITAKGGGVTKNITDHDTIPGADYIYVKCDQYVKNPSDANKVGVNLMFYNSSGTCVFQPIDYQDYATEKELFHNSTGLKTHDDINGKITIYIKASGSSAATFPVTLTVKNLKIYSK